MARAAVLAAACLLVASRLACGDVGRVPMTATGSGVANAGFAPRELAAEVEGPLEFDLAGTVFRGPGHGEGTLELRTFAGWAWAVVWARASGGDSSDAELAGGLAVEGPPALGSGSVRGTCAFVVCRGALRTEYRGTFVTQAVSHLVPATRAGVLSLEGEVEITFSLTPCGPNAPSPWDSARWPADLLEEFVCRAGS